MIPFGTYLKQKMFINKRIFWRLNKNKKKIQLTINKVENIIFGSKECRLNLNFFIGNISLNSKGSDDDGLNLKKSLCEQEMYYSMNM